MIAEQVIATAADADTGFLLAMLIFIYLTIAGTWAHVQRLKDDERRDRL